MSRDPGGLPLGRIQGRHAPSCCARYSPSCCARQAPSCCACHPWPSFLLLALVIVLWSPALLHGRTILHGDSIIHSVPLMRLQAEWFRGRAALSWAPGIYGGHPLFAEGQGGFASPLNLLFAGVVTPLLGVVASMNLFHAVTMALAGLGVIGLARETGASPWSACFAGLAVTFAPDMLRHQDNITVGGTLAWAPWMIWMAERWVGRGGARAACLTGLAFAGGILAGYPQVVHACAVYVAIRIAGARWFERRRLRGRELALAAGVGLGASAVQWLPLLQLASLSVRSAGIGMVWHLPLAWYGQGALFTHAARPNVGSPLVMLAFAAGGLLWRSGRMRAHLAATAVLVLLGLETNSFAFRFVYAWHLLPGLHAFRVTDLYLLVGQIGGACIAAHGVERIEALAAWPPRRAALVAGSTLALLCVGRQCSAGTSGDGLQLAVALVAVVSVSLAMATGRGRASPLVLALLLAAECTSVRLHPFGFFAPGLLAQPASVSAFKAMADWRDYRTWDHTIAGTYAMSATTAPGFLQSFEAMQNAYSGMTDVTYGVASLDGALALELARRGLLDATLARDVDCGSVGRAGRRMIDVLGVRAFSAYGGRRCSGFRSLTPGLNGIQTVENLDARRRVQVYGRHVSVDTPAAALAAFEASAGPVLVIENPDRRPEMRDDPGQDGDAPVEVIEDRPTFVRVGVSAGRRVWLFLADADYPGWHADLDGVATPLFAAQVLGKAVGVPAGRHVITFRFRSRPIEAGLAISLATLATLLAGGLLAAGQGGCDVGRRQTRRPGRRGAMPGTAGR